jgi:hypothetical protein
MNGTTTNKWNNITISGSSTITLSANLNCSGTFTNTSGVNLFNGNTFNIGGSLTMTNGTVGGTTAIVLNGTGTWSAGTANAAILGSGGLTINTAGTITISSTVYFNTGTLTYTAGTISHVSNSLLSITTTTTLNTSAMAWNSVTFTGSFTVTLLSDLDINGTTNISGTTVTTTFSGAYTVYCAGNITLNGTAEVFASAGGFLGIVYDGTGIISATTSGTCGFKCNFTINTAGTLTFGSATGQSINFASCTLAYTAGTVVFTGTTAIGVFANLPVSLNLSGTTISKIDIGSNTTVTLLSNFNVTTMNLNNTTTFVGAYNISCGTLTSAATIAATYTFVSTQTLSISTAITCVGTAAAKISFVASSAGNKAIVTLAYGATQNVGFANATDIDSSLGQTIWTRKGTITTTNNWKLLVAPTTIATSF